MAENLADRVIEVNFIIFFLFIYFKIHQAAAFGFGIVGMNGNPVYARACSEALPRLFALISAPEKNTAIENAISAVTKIFKCNSVIE